MGLHEAFIEGGENMRLKILNDLRASTADWNYSPSVEVIEFVVKRIKKLPVPVAEKEEK